VKRIERYRSFPDKQGKSLAAQGAEQYFEQMFDTFNDIAESTNGHSAAE
jgi:hypothetical protein